MYIYPSLKKKYDLLIDKSLFNNEDKVLLRESIKNNTFLKDIYKLSIISQQGVYTETNYQFTTYNNNDFYYYPRMQIWLDNELKLLPFCKRWVGYDSFFETFINNINHYLRLIKNINTEKAQFKEGNFVFIQSWFKTYGHFLDEVFCLKDFIGDKDYKPLFSFNTNTNKNYLDYCNILFDKNFYDVNDDPLIKVNNIIIIKHYYNDKNFHSFPLDISNYIKSTVIVEKDKKDGILFLTRGIATHLPRNLENQKEIEEYLLSKNVCIFNPEENNINDMIKIIDSYSKIIITWGSALTNLCFCNYNSNILILKSKSYMREKLSNFFYKIIDARQLKIDIIESKDNIIDCEKLDFFLN